MKRCFVLVLAAYVLFSACTASRYGGADSPVTTREHSRDTRLVEDFDPLTLQDDDIVVPPPSVSREPLGTTDEHLDEERDRTDVEEGAMIQGFRVQLMATSDEEQARELHRNAIFRFPQDDVYMSFEGSLYKVRVGDCRTREQAEDLRDLAVRNGFRDAWIVPAKVYQ